MELKTPISAVKVIMKRHLAPLEDLGVKTVRDLVFYFPFRYDDFTKTVSLKDVVVGEQITLAAKVEKFAQKRSWQRKIAMSEAVVTDGTGKLTVLWFHLPFIAKKIAVGATYRFSGKVTQTKYGQRLVNPLFEETADRDASFTAPIMPVYPLVQGISQHALRRLIRLVEPLMKSVLDPLSPAILKRYELLPLNQAVRWAHGPETQAQVASARRRIGFDEMLRLQLSVGRMKAMRQAKSAPAIPFDQAVVKKFVDGLPFVLTDDQRRAAMEVLRDMERGLPMHRLLDGDVGSGKTAVAAVAARNAAAAGYQTAIMAPTEILASQHFATLSKLFKKENLTIALWTNGYKRACKKGKVTICGPKSEVVALGQEIADGKVAIVVGTHALIEDAISFDKLALAVVDEQHRFGVRTRAALMEKSGMPGMEPHLLSMTATPIPRTLALTAYGDLDLSLLREKPKGRQPIATKVVTKKERIKTYAFIREQIAAGRQVFIVCPCIEESDFLGVASVTEEHAKLTKGEMKGIKLAMLHGKMTAKEKEAVMAEFVAGKTKALVSTSVIEVGVDIPNATVMCVEGAERFGLAQLHQFRGRIGRGAHASHCFLFPSDAANPMNARLRAMETIDDGFTLAEKDLELRGAGEILGTAQSGLPELRMASFGDAKLIADAREAAAELLASGELEKNPVLREMLIDSIEKAHLE